MLAKQAVLQRMPKEPLCIAKNFVTKALEHACQAISSLVYALPSAYGVVQQWWGEFGRPAAAEGRLSVLGCCISCIGEQGGSSNEDSAAGSDDDGSGGVVQTGVGFYYPMTVGSFC